MLTAAGLVPSGVMYLTLTSLGSYAQCLSTQVHEDSDNATSPILFKGQYCGLHVLPNQEVYNALLERIEKLGDIQVSESRFNVLKPFTIITRLATTSKPLKHFTQNEIVVYLCVRYSYACIN